MCMENIHTNIQHPNLEMKCCCYNRVMFFSSRALERMQTRRFFLSFASKIVLVPIY